MLRVWPLRPGSSLARTQAPRPLIRDTRLLSEMELGIDPVD
jgi:hypothetical protein